MNARIPQAEQQATEEKLLKVTLPKTMVGSIAGPLSYDVGSSPTDLPRIADSTATEHPQEDTANETNEQKETDSESTTDFQLTNSKWFFKEEISVDIQEVNRRECEVSGLVPKKAEIKASEDGLTITVKGESKPISNFTVHL